MTTRIDNKQKALIHVAKTKLGLDEDIYREILRQEAGVTSAKDLSLLGFDRVMKRFKKLGFSQKDKRPSAPAQTQSGKKSVSVNGMATKKEIWKIGQMEKELGWDDNPKRLIGFVKKYAGVERVEWLTHKQAWRVIEALKKLLQKQHDQADPDNSLAK